MEIKLGAVIKKLRTQMGVTQEELADFVGVSFQAVSKWETDTTLPDIALLPALSKFFGVSIDTLFSVNSRDELDRIDFMLENERLSDESIACAKRSLDDMQKNDENDVCVLKCYARLYQSSINRDGLAAGRLLEKAISVSPQDGELYGMLRQVRGGDSCVSHSGNDWFIRFCEPYSDKYPDNERLNRLLLDAYIEMRYYDRAVSMIEKIRQTDKSGIAEIFLGDIEYFRGNIKAAEEIWESVDKNSVLLQYEAGERFNRAGEYDRAIECFENSFKAGACPRDLSSTYSLAFLHTKLGDIKKAIEMWERILDVLKSDYGITEGTQVEWPRREIDKLKERL